jgi:hypothetical protein
VIKIPNWIHNYLTVSGNKNSLQKFVDEVAHEEHGKKIRDEFLDEDTVVNQPLSFEKIIPMPTDLRATTSPNRDEQMVKRFIELYDAKDWYDWANKNWGTKWDASFHGPFCALSQEDSNVEVPEKRTPIISSGFAFYAFDTAWSPPIPVIERASGIWHDLKFELKYGDAGMGDAGCLIYEDGILVSEEILPVEEVLNEKDMWF